MFESPLAAGIEATLQTPAYGGARVLPFSWQGFASRVENGSNVISTLGAEFDGMSVKRVMLVSSARAFASDAGRRIVNALGSRLVEQFTAVPSHSSEEAVRLGVECARDQRIDGLVALGGGSVSDTAKAITIVLAEGGKIADHANIFYPPDGYVQKRLDKPKLPIIAIPTTASAAEVTPGLGIRAYDGHKMVFWDAHVVPRLILLDSEAFLETPVEVMASTAMNAFAHCVEGLYSRVSNPISSAIALQAARMLCDSIPAMVGASGNQEHRNTVMLGAHMSGQVISNARVGLHHAICHGLGSLGGLAHGDANAIMLPHVVRYNRDAAASQLAGLADALGEDTRHLGAGNAAERAVKRIASLQSDAGVPTRLRDVGFDRSLITPIADMTLADRGSYFNPVVAPPKADIEAIIGAAW